MQTVTNLTSKRIRHNLIEGGVKKDTNLTLENSALNGKKIKPKSKRIVQKHCTPVGKVVSHAGKGQYSEASVQTYWHRVNE